MLNKAVCQAENVQEVRQQLRQKQWHVPKPDQDPDWDLVIRDARLKISEYESRIKDLRKFTEQARQCRSAGVRFRKWTKFIKEGK